MKWPIEMRFAYVTNVHVSPTCKTSTHVPEKILGILANQNAIDDAQCGIFRTYCDLYYILFTQRYIIPISIYFIVYNHNVSS